MPDKLRLGPTAAPFAVVQCQRADICTNKVSAQNHRKGRPCNHQLVPTAGDPSRSPPCVSLGVRAHGGLSRCSQGPEKTGLLRRVRISHMCARVVGSQRYVCVEGQAGDGCQGHVYRAGLLLHLNPDAGVRLSGGARAPRCVSARPYLSDCFLDFSRCVGCWCVQGAQAMEETRGHLPG